MNRNLHQHMHELVARASNQDDRYDAQLNASRAVSACLVIAFTAILLLVAMLLMWQATWEEGE